VQVGGVIIENETVQEQTEQIITDEIITTEDAMMVIAE